MQVLRGKDIVVEQSQRGTKMIMMINDDNVDGEPEAGDSSTMKYVIIISCHKAGLPSTVYIYRKKEAVLWHGVWVSDQQLPVLYVQHLGPREAVR